MKQAAVADLSGIAAPASVPAAAAARPAVEQSTAAALAARPAAALGAEGPLQSVDLAHEPVDRPEGQAGGVVDGPEVVLRITPVGDRRRDHDVARPIVEGQGLTRDRVVEQVAGPHL